MTALGDDDGMPRTYKEGSVCTWQSSGSSKLPDAAPAAAAAKANVLTCI